MKYLLCTLLNFSLLQVAAMAQIPSTDSLRYPATHRDETIKDDYFGTAVADPYRWLEDENSNETKNWVEAQNKVAFSYLENIPFRAAMKERMTEVWNFPKESAPHKAGAYYYYFKNNGLQPQSIMYRKKGLDGAETVFFDPNILSKDGTTSMAEWSFSKDGRYFAFSVSQGGSDWREVRIIDAERNTRLPDHLTDIKFSGMAWYGNGFFYSRYQRAEAGKELSDKNEFCKIYYHRVGDMEQAQDVLVYEDPKHPLRTFGAYLTDDERYLLISVSEATEYNMLYVARSDAWKQGFTPIIEDFKSNVNVVGNDGDDLLLLTDRNAPNQKVVRVAAAAPAEKNWKTLIAESDKPLAAVYMAGGKMIAQYMENVSDRLYVYDYQGSRLPAIELPGAGTVGALHAKHDQDEVFYTFTSYIYPSTIFRYDMKSGTSEIYRKSQAKFNPDEYESKQVFYPSKDGTKIPMLITHKKGVVLDGNNPVLLYAYGGFNISVKPQFDVSKLVFLENGGVYAVANLRGGSEYGEAWHKGGMLLNKQNVFDDYIAAAEYLIAQKYTNSQRLAISGRSNGGLLVGATMAQRPELFKVALPAVGVMDMLRYEKFTIGWAWAGEYGSVAEKEHFDNIFKYSPLHNLKKGTHYPATLVTTADHDDRVVPAHSYKFAAALQYAHQGDNPVLIRIDTKAGHGYGKSTQQYIEENTDIMSFVFYNLGMTLKK